MPRVQTVKVADKEIIVTERRIGELKTLVASLVPSSGGNLADIDMSALANLKIDELLYEKLPEVFPGLDKEDVDKAYTSEIEALVEAFIDVHFLGLKRLAGPLMGLAQAGATQRAAQGGSKPPKCK